MKSNYLNETTFRIMFILYNANVKPVTYQDNYKCLNTLMTRLNILRHLDHVKQTRQIVKFSN